MHEAGDLGPYGRSRIAHRPSLDIDAADMADQDLARHRQTGRQYDGEAGVLSEMAGEITKAGLRPACSRPAVGSKSVQIRSPATGT